VTLAIFRCRKITISAVNGHAAGVGITGLQLPCDFRFVWAGAKLAFPFIRRGIAPEGTWRTRLPLLILKSCIRTTVLLRSGIDLSPPAPPWLFPHGGVTAQRRHILARLATPARIVPRYVPKSRGRISRRASVRT
jgi:hypothetical protein